MTEKVSIDEMVDGIKKRFPRALGKLITLVENRPEEAYDVLDKLHPMSGHAYVLGVTGALGTGKSTLTAGIAKAFRDKDLTVGIIAVDPTSPFSGGALLGDRVRMGDIIRDDGVFIRSLATRGALGGLSRACDGAIKVMDAYGMDIIIVETVGVGQDEIDIIKSSDACLLVLMPGMGDEIQTLKAGVMEIADIFVINKADFAGAERLALSIKMMLELSGIERKWEPPVFQTISSENKGIDELMEGIDEFRELQEKNALLHERRMKRVRNHITLLIENEILRHVNDLLRAKFPIDQLLDDVATKRKSPYLLTREIVESLF